MAKYWFHDLHIMSTDPVKTSQFYEKMFGVKITGTSKLSDGRTNIAMDFKGANIQTASLKTPADPCGIDHFCLQTDDIEAAVADLKKKGAEITEGVRVLPKVKLAFVKGPDNVKIELIQVL